ncbi:hypothetical protein Asppvi_007039 [Aspergillus pseudoviridinutans]|uniref:Cytochrome P450 n=1 Tax=Aspergillus pseudoviridinutans TaxID=1517512 RepID=A0A9P3BBC9_9EURO|nr:uncharacterized protein Asppvi_007039 [Aspergillus pseudoviridinutans]GIJ88122.1 hypothetical protein Asppvi_007039 [Aspergillus pseudoviridinutans]
MDYLQNEKGILQHLDIKIARPTVVGLIVAAVMSLVLVLRRQAPSIPVINGRTRLRGQRLQDFLVNAQDLIRLGFKRSRVFQLMTNLGPMILLSSEYIEEIKNDTRLSLSLWFHKEYFSDLAGFAAFRLAEMGPIMRDAIKLRLTYGFDNIVEPISTETSCFLADNWSDNEEWREVLVSASVEKLAARFASLLFYGPELRANKEWNAAQEEYLKTAWRAVEELRLWPQPLRPIIHWFLPTCRTLRRQERAVRSLIEPVLAARQTQGEHEVVNYNDSIQWLADAARGRSYDAAMGPLAFVGGASPATVDLLSQVLLDLSERPELIDALRQEVSNVKPHINNWAKHEMQQLRLMDSVLKETQRLKPVESVMMKRTATQSLTLSDGYHIPRGSNIGVSVAMMRDPDIYTCPDEYDGYRFLRMREQRGYETIAQLTCTSPIHLGFGHGLQSCPARFFVSTQIKIVLCHILLKYDIKPVGEGARVQPYGLNLLADPTARLLVRRRSAESLL